MGAKGFENDAKLLSKDPLEHHVFESQDVEFGWSLCEALGIGTGH